MKYHNRWTRCSSDHNHASKLEAEYCDQLRLLKKTHNIVGYEVQQKFELKVNGKHICNHIVDFLVYTNKLLVESCPGLQEAYQPEVHETKGFVTRDWKIKRKLFEALYPGIKYIVIGGQKTWETRRKRTSSR